jgi:hypothetical protein
MLKIGPEIHFFFNPVKIKDFFILSKSLGTDFYLLQEMVLNAELISKMIKNEVL